MYSCTKLQIYKGMIQYILESTPYTLKRIAALTNSTISNIRSIYNYNQIPSSFPEEIHLIQLYQIILDIEKKRLVRIVE